jgi:hypothetical protein
VLIALVKTAQRGLTDVLKQNLKSVMTLAC